MSYERDRSRPRNERRNLNADEMYAMGFWDLRAEDNEEGWPYPDEDEDDENEERRGRLRQ